VQPDRVSKHPGGFARRFYQSKIKGFEIMEKEKKGSCFPRPPFKKKHLTETLTVGFIAGVAATISLFKLIKK